MTVRTLETTTQCIVLVRTYPAAPDILYSTLLDPERVCQWCALPGETCRILRWDPEEGVEFRILVRQRTTGDIRSIEGDFVALEPPRRIIATFQPETPERHPDTPRLVVELTPEEIQTRLRLMHARLAGPEEVETAAEEWQTRLERIEETIPTRERLPVAPT
ncbi:MAG: SRPBCC domain-containing protein [Euryarchaeota archaeon]|nr:SRPBCC domain-containing protein [Euryarchaeota archaeon]